MPKRTYTTKGAEYTQTDKQKEKLQAAIERIQWFDLPLKDDDSIPFSQGYALKNMVKVMGRKADRVGYGIYGDRYSLLAMRNNYDSGDTRRATVYALDNGDDRVTSVAIDEETIEDLKSINQSI